MRYNLARDLIAIVVLTAVMVFCLTYHAPQPENGCTTDAECARIFGGDGGPTPLH